MSFLCKKRSPVCESSDSGKCDKNRARSNCRSRPLSRERTGHKSEAYVVKEVKEYIAPARPAMRPVCSECPIPDVKLDPDNLSPCGEVQSDNDKAV
ncbi:hypothetical protein RRG08_035345 [Elysia crispata]|uniref:Uncharacterized protein n=1 Tax=Elysia crispata TaxID=231223 RepID=A0AAE0Y4V2_9GAST|nr:hypothetical protein RRG08_035345 [Elysia crispata]